MKITIKKTEEVPDLTLKRRVIVGTAGQYDFVPLTTSEMIKVLQDFKKKYPGMTAVEISAQQMHLIVFALRNTTPLILSDRMYEQYISKGELPGFMGMNWTTAKPDTGLTAVRGVNGRVLVTDEDGVQRTYVREYGSPAFGDE